MRAPSLPLGLRPVTLSGPILALLAAFSWLFSATARDAASEQLSRIQARQATLASRITLAAADLERQSALAARLAAAHDRGLDAPLDGHRWHEAIEGLTPPDEPTALNHRVGTEQAPAGMESTVTALRQTRFSLDFNPRHEEDLLRVLRSLGDAIPGLTTRSCRLALSPMETSPGQLSALSAHCEFAHTYLKLSPDRPEQGRREDGAGTAPRDAVPRKDAQER